jgi:hypothetical protein
MAELSVSGFLGTIAQLSDVEPMLKNKMAVLGQVPATTLQRETSSKWG